MTPAETGSPNSCRYSGSRPPHGLRLGSLERRRSLVPRLILDAWHVQAPTVSPAARACKGDRNWLRCFLVDDLRPRRTSSPPWVADPCPQTDRRWFGSLSITRRRWIADDFRPLRSPLQSDSCRANRRCPLELNLPLEAGLSSTLARRSAGCHQPEPRRTSCKRRCQLR